MRGTTVTSNVKESAVVRPPALAVRAHVKVTVVAVKTSAAAPKVRPTAVVVDTLTVTSARTEPLEDAHL